MCLSLSISHFHSLGLDQVFIYSLVNHFSFGLKWTKTDRRRSNGPKLKWIQREGSGSNETEMDQSKSKGIEKDQMGRILLKETKVNPKKKI